MNIIIRNCIFLLLLVTCTRVLASHYRAGEITYEQISGRLYRVTAITYTDPNSPANEFTTTISMSWGDGNTEEVPRAGLNPIVPGVVQQNIYIATHQYSTAGTFLVSFADPNRVANIVNINGGFSDNTPFYVESLIRISTTLLGNTSPQLRTLPVFDGCLNFYYTHNPGAYDPDGDSLAYVIIPPKQAPKLEVPNYTQPAASDSFELDPYTGTLYWVKPTVLGLHNIAIRIEEWRYGVLMGYVVRDMQIRIVECFNNPPTPPTYVNSCVQAGDSVKFNIVSTDVNVQWVTIKGMGGPFELPVSPAILSPPGEGQSIATTQFLWKTDCRHIRYRAHTGTLQAYDNFSTPLASYSTFEIKVIGPAPVNLKTKQIGNGFVISWNKDTCAVANQYKVYRKVDSTQFTPTSCQTGLPASLGYTLIGTVKGDTYNNTDTFFYDDDKGNGLSPLINYCYRVVAVFPARNDNGQNIVSQPSESYASIEVCDVIIRSTPILTLASVRFTDLVNGAIKVSWIRPDTLDTAIYKAPYRVICARAILKEGVIGAYTNVQTYTYPSFASITDSTLIDTFLNTVNNQYVYRMEFQYDSNGVSKTIGYSPVASSVYAVIYSTDNTNIISWLHKVPWINETFTVFRKNTATGLFDSLATVPTTETYSDTGLINGVSYQYYVQSDGYYSFFNTPIINLSQLVDGIPLDTVKPCAPILTVTPPCDDFNTFSNKLNWVPKSKCADDVLSYNIYYKKFVSDTYKLIGSVDASVLNFSDSRDTLKFSIAGCYAVTGIDSFNNESNFENTICIDNCPMYEIPNVFTPGNADSKNDLLLPLPYRFIDHIELHIYNRWGAEVFKTTNIDIEWDGNDLKSGAECSAGTYYYTCDVYEQYLYELKNNKRRGTITLIR